MKLKVPQSIRNFFSPDTIENSCWRIRESFLILPKVINNEFRWLVKAKWEEICVNRIDLDGIGGTYKVWEATKWI